MREVRCRGRRDEAREPLPEGRRSVPRALRPRAAAVGAALAAKGTSVIDNIDQIDRGYEDIDGRLRGLGAKIERVA